MNRVGKTEDGKDMLYEEWKAVQGDDPYGKCIFAVAEAWADEMEKGIASGKAIKDIAQSTFSEVDKRPGFGVTGFMYGAAVSVLARCWEHGEELRVWHNLDTQMGTEGEEANAKGSVLNPALLRIG